MNDQVLPAELLPEGIRARRVPGVNGLDMHVLEAGPDSADAPVVLALHGFPELAFSWRHIMPGLALLGYRVIAPDQRGYGLTTGNDVSYAADIGESRMVNLVRDALGLLDALGIAHVDCLIGHDFGSPVAAWCSLLRPDVFRAVVLMSAPFGGPPPLPGPMESRRPVRDVHADLAALARPRRHYQWYYGTPEANDHMWRCKEGVHAFLRAYFHMKSADWPDNRPYRLRAWDADSLALLPTYYVMDLEQTMAATVAPHHPASEAVSACEWLPEADMAVYAREYGRTGFQGGLNWYRAATSARFVAEMQVFAGRAIEVPACFIAGAADWGVRQKPGDFERMGSGACSDFRGAHLIDGAGHWVQQEQPAKVLAVLECFLGGLSAR